MSQPFDVTCLEVSGSVGFVGGSTVMATEARDRLSAIRLFLEDRGAGLPDKSTIFALFATVPSNPCLELFGPAAETSLRGNIEINGEGRRSRLSGARVATKPKRYFKLAFESSSSCPYRSCTSEHRVNTF